MLLKTSKLLRSTSLIFPKQVPQFSTKKKKFSETINYYQLLNINKNATPQQIKKSFYEYSKKYHPDISPQHQQKYNQVKQAYQILSNKDLRKQYDTIFSNPIQKQHQQQSSKYSRTGPYQTQQQYNQHRQKSYSHHTKAQWRKIRLGFRKQSYISYQSDIQRQKGATSQSQIMHYKQISSRQIRLQVQQQMKNKIPHQVILKQQEFLRKRHQQRVNKLFKQLSQERAIKFKNSLLGRLIAKFKGLFVNKTQN